MKFHLEKRWQVHFLEMDLVNEREERIQGEGHLDRFKLNVYEQMKQEVGKCLMCSETMSDDSC